MSGCSRFLKLVGELAYRRSPPWDSGDPAPELVELVEGPAPPRPGRALDLGCGIGTNAVYLARHGWDVTGVDLVHNAVAAARVRWSGPRRRSGHEGLASFETDDRRFLFDLSVVHSAWWAPPSSRASWSRAS
jgi:SAM-dependent methyltransferase